MLLIGHIEHPSSKNKLNYEDNCLVRLYMIKNFERIMYINQIFINSVIIYNTFSFK